MWESSLSIRGFCGAVVAGFGFAIGWVIATNALALIASLLK